MSLTGLESARRTRYARMGVQEYFRYDPLGQTMARKHGARRLIGERLVDGVCRELPIGPRGAMTERNGSAP